MEGGTCTWVSLLCNSNEAASEENEVREDQSPTWTYCIAPQWRSVEVEVNCKRRIRRAQVIEDTPELHPWNRPKKKGTEFIWTEESFNQAMINDSAPISPPRNPHFFEIPAPFLGIMWWRSLSPHSTNKSWIANSADVAPVGISVDGEMVEI